jgi:nucleotide-binding universal stress UspA family protein
VLLAVDDSDASRRAATTAHQLFGEGAAYVAVNVADIGELTPAMAGAWGAAYPVPWGMTWSVSVPPMGSGTTDATDALRSAARATADDVVADAGVTGAEPVGAIGDPVEAILRAAHERNVDVVVVGATEQSWFARLVHPSVSKDLIQRADVPVLVVK